MLADVDDDWDMVEAVEDIGWLMKYLFVFDAHR
jgi:hypothetical protein